MNKKKALFLLITLLAGCGGGESTPTSTNNKVEEEVVDNTPSSLLQTQDSYAVVKPYQEESVSLAEYIPLNARVTKVLNDSGDPLCDVTEVNNAGFKVKINALMPCRYSYQVQTDTTAASVNAKVLTSKAPLRSAVNGARIAESDYQAAITVLTSTSDNSLLPPIAIAMQSNTTLSIDLKNGHYPDGYVLQDAPTLMGNGEIVSFDKAQQTITFKAGAEGMSRITYTLKGTNAEGQDDLNLGVIDIAASDAANRAPLAYPFTFTSELMANSTAVDIDVTKYISANGDTDDLRLVYVSSLTATVELKEPEASTNKVFTFAASTPGTHSVTYGIFDHHGGYAINIVTVHVSGLDYSQWNSLFYNGNMFTAPLTALEASAMGVTATSLTDFKERTYTPSIPMATFNYTDAKNYCERVHKGRLPTIEEVHYFFQQTDSNGNPDKDKQPHKLKEGRWPTSANYYIAYSSDVHLNDTIVRLHRPNSAANRPYDEAATGQTSFYVTCVVPLNVTFTTTVTNNNAVANDSELIHVDITVVDKVGNNVNSGKINIEVLISEGVTMTTDASQAVSGDSNRFSFKSTKAVTVPLKVDYNGNIFLTNITFVADRSTARIVELTKVRDGQPAGRPYKNNAISLVALDAFNNPVPGMKVILSGGNEAADFFAETPEIATDEVGRLTDYGIRLLRLPNGMLTKTDSVNIRLENTSGTQTVELTNTYPAVMYSESSTSLITAAAMVSEVTSFDPSEYTPRFDPITGFTYALMDQATGRRFCEQLDKHGYDDWVLGYASEIGQLMIEFKGSPFGDRLNVFGWPNGNYWAGLSGGGGPIFTGESGTAFSSNPASRYYIPCTRY